MKKKATIILSLLAVLVAYSEETITREFVETDPVKKRPQLSPDRPDPLEKSFPRHWGHPPRIQVRDHVKLPGKFGFGSSTLAKWIVKNLKNDGLVKPIIDPQPKPELKPKPRPDRPEPSAEVKEKIRMVQEKQREMFDMRKKLRTSLREEPLVHLRDELIDNFREASKEKLQSLKEAQQEHQKEVRSKIQTGARRE